MSELNTIYIISKGRPQCTTAQTLYDLDYRGDWFICCGDNDKSLPEYLEKWGDRVIIYDWRKYAEKTKTLDNFGIDNYPTGVPPVREAVREISEKRGEKRHWQFDDDMRTFYIKHPITRKKLRVDAYILEKYLNIFSNFAHKTGIANCGFENFESSYPANTFRVSYRNFILHNLPSNKSDFVEWKGRTCDDITNIIDSYRYGKPIIRFGFFNYSMFHTMTEEGGSTDLYDKISELRKCDYTLMLNPLANFDSRNEKVNLRTKYPNFTPKLISEKYKRE